MKVTILLAPFHSGWLRGGRFRVNTQVHSLSPEPHTLNHLSLSNPPPPLLSFCFFLFFSLSLLLSLFIYLSLSL